MVGLLPEFSPDQGLLGQSSNTCGGIADAAVVLRVGEHRFGMVVVHVFADPCADGISEGVCRHRYETRGMQSLQ